MSFNARSPTMYHVNYSALFTFSIYLAFFDTNISDRPILHCSTHAPTQTELNGYEEMSCETCPRPPPAISDLSVPPLHHPFST